MPDTSSPRTDLAACEGHSNSRCDYADAISYNPLSHRGVLYPSGRHGVGERVFRTHAKKSTDEAIAAMCAEIVRVQSRSAGDLRLFELVREMAESHERTGGKKSTMDKYKSSLNNGVPKLIRGTHGSELTTAQLQEIFDHLNTEGATPGYIKAVRTALGAFIEWAVTHERSIGAWAEPAAMKDRCRRAVNRANSQGVAKGRNLVAYEDCPARADVEAYADALEVVWPGYGRRAALFSYGCGVRPSELIALGPDDIDLSSSKGDGIVVSVDGQASREGEGLSIATTKNSRTRTTHLWECYRDVAESLVADALLRGDDRLFPLPDPSKNAARHFERLRRRAANDIGWQWRHGWLRHAFASVSMAVTPFGYGIDDALVSRWLGHASVAFTRAHYVQARVDDCRDLSERTGQVPR